MGLGLPLVQSKPAGGGVLRSALLCPAGHPPQFLLASPARPGASSLAWAPSHVRPSTAHRCGRRQSGRRKPPGDADRLACEAWNKRMLGFEGPAQPSPTPGDALNGGFGYLEDEMFWPQHASDRCPRHRAATEDNTGP
jgi:hypothetical protein